MTNLAAVIAVPDGAQERNASQTAARGLVQCASTVSFLKTASHWINPALQWYSQYIVSLRS